MQVVSLLSVVWLHESLYVFVRKEATHHGAAPPISFIKSILFVDVRKSGGKQLKQRFEVISSDIFVANSTLSHLTKGYMHTVEYNKGGPSPVLHEADAFLFNLRHPIDRIIAWHRFENPHYCIDNQTTSKACATMQFVEEYPHEEGAVFYVDCFPTPDLFASAFATTNTLSPECIKLAHQVFNNKISGPGFSQTPFYYNLRYYSERTIDLFAEKIVLVVRSESVWDDLNGLERQLGGSTRFDTLQDSNLESDMRSNAKVDYGPLCCQMIDEMREYSRLLQLALNLDEAAKKDTLTRAVQLCNFTYWSEMEQTCQQQRHQQQQDMSSKWSINNILSIFARQKEAL